MARSIQTLLDQILSAVYGEQVRTAIHDSIETCYDDVESGVTAAEYAAEQTSAILGDVEPYIDGQITVANVISAAQEATNDATSATDEALSAASEVQEAITASTTVTATANAAAAFAREQGNLAKDNAALANTKAELADSKATAAQAIIDRWNGTDGSTGILSNINTAIGNANAATEATGSVTEEAQAIIDRWNGDDGETGISEEVQAIIDRWNGDDGEQALSATIANAAEAASGAAEEARGVVTQWNGDEDTPGLRASIVSATNAATNAANLAEVATTEAYNQASAAQTRASEAREAAEDAATAISDTREAIRACNNAAETAETSADLADDATDRANAASDLIENMEVAAIQGSTGTSSVLIETVTDSTGPHYRITFTIAKGDKGDSMSVKGEAYNTITDLQAAHPPESTPVGDMYNVGTEPPYHVYRNTGSFWEDQGTIGITIDNLTQNDLDQIWSNDYPQDGSGKYISDKGLLYLIQQKIVSALAGKVDKVTNKGLSTNDFTNDYAAMLGPVNTNGSLLYMIKSLEDTKVNKDGNKVLSTLDYTQFDKNKLAEISNKLDKTDIDSVLDTTSTKPVRNSVITRAINDLTDATLPIGDLALPYSEASSYAVGAYCMYNRIFYRCVEEVSGGEAFNASKWAQVTVASEMNSAVRTASSAQATVSGFDERISTAEETVDSMRETVETISGSFDTLQTDVEAALANFAEPYSTSKVYETGEFCTYDGALYRCTQDMSSSQATFDGLYWEAVKVGDVIGDVDFSELDTEIDTIESDIGNLQNDVSSLDSRIDVLETDVIVVNFPSFSSLPQTVDDSRITADHYVMASVVGTPNAQAGNWTVTTVNGSLTVSGTMTDGVGTTLQLILAKAGTTITQVSS